MGILDKLRLQSSVEDFKTLQLWRSVLAEYLGTLLLTFVGLASCMNQAESHVKVLHISLCFGLSVGTIVWAIAHVSGGHINPAVTLGMLLGRRVSFIRAIFYVIAQLLGAVSGALILYIFLPVPAQGAGVTLPDASISAGSAVVIEVIITFILVFTVFATCDPSRVGFNGSGPLSIGLSVTMCHLAFVPFTGASMNTARSFGPAVVFGQYKDHWVYWAGPLIGGALAGLFYELVFASDASAGRLKVLFLSPTFDASTYAETCRVHHSHCNLAENPDENGGTNAEGVELLKVNPDADLKNSETVVA